MPEFSPRSGAHLSAQPSESRTMILAGMTILTAGPSAFFVRRSSSILAASRPISKLGWATDAMRGRKESAHGKSSKLVMAISSGHSRPLSCSAPTRLRVMKLLVQKTASGNGLEFSMSRATPCAASMLDGLEKNQVFLFPNARRFQGAPIADDPVVNGSWLSIRPQIPRSACGRVQ